MMKKYFEAVLFVLILSLTAYSQQVKVSFVGSDVLTSAPVTLDSVRVQNLTTLKDTVLRDPFIINLGTTTGVDDKLLPLRTSLELSGNFANPFIDQTRFRISTATSGKIEVELYSMVGKLMASLQMNASPGRHEFTLDGRGLTPGVYILVAKDGQHAPSMRIMKSGTTISSVPMLTYDGSITETSNPVMRKTSSLASYRFIGYASGNAPDSVLAAPTKDTTVVFRFLNTPPSITSFIADSYTKLTGDTVQYTVSMKDTEGNLSRVLIDYNGDGVFDDSTAVSGSNATKYFKTVFKTAGSYLAKARVIDSKGLNSEKTLSTSVIVTQSNTAPSIASFVADSYSKSTTDTVKYTLSIKDAEANLSKAWIDFDGNGVFDDSTSISGGDALTYFKTVFKTAGSYLAKARAMDSKGLYSEKTLTTSVIVTQSNTAPSIASFIADSYSKSTTDTVKYTLSIKDAEGNLSKAWIDFNGDGVFDDSTSISGGDVLTYFRKVFSTPGSYLAKARAMDNKGLSVEKSLINPVIVAQILPTITGIDPASNIKDSTEITITGEHFGASQGSNNVFFKGGDSTGGNYYVLSATHYTSWSDTQIKVNVPAGVNADGVLYVTVGGLRSNEAAFQINKLPILTTIAVSDTTTNSAKSGGTITSDRGFPVTARGVCWSTASNPTTADSTTNDGIGIGAFTSELTGLDPNTQYFVRAYATNSEGTAYGNELSFTTLQGQEPILTTTVVTNITLTSAASGGTITSDGGFPVTARGVCWSTLNNPTIANTKTSDGAGTGSFTSNLTGLNPNTTFYVRAYATNSDGTGYGNEISFTTQQGQEPVLTTANVINITQTTATSGGTITSDGGFPVTARGVCWNTTGSPTITNSKTSDGVGTGTFISNLSGLNPNTTYYVRAYAKNSIGTGYGDEISFTTQGSGGGGSVTIGTQVWATKNLDVTTYRNGDPIPQVTNPTDWRNLTTGAWCYYNNDPATGAVYGKLYNWYAVNDPRGLAPTGWHVPTDAEWKTLEMFLGMTQSQADSTGWRGNDEGGKLKEAGIAHWYNPNNGATNSSGFTALPGGYRYGYFVSGYDFNKIYIVGVWWSSTETSAIYAASRAMYHLNPGVSRTVSDDKKMGLSVRCVKD